MNTPAASIFAYLRAKDSNRPHLLEQAFAPDALLEMVGNTAATSFPPASRGREAIADVLVRNFSRNYENVYTFCLSPPPLNEAGVFSCDWLVIMTEKEVRSVRVGCGRYDWCFAASGLVECLSITIETMQSLPPAMQDEILPWASDLPYPWCTAEAAARGAPTLELLVPVLGYIGRERLRHGPPGETPGNSLASEYVEHRHRYLQDHA
ncbi:MAG: nuclear transport factor 2 family protein [Polaromonas sp.]